MPSSYTFFGNLIEFDCHFGCQVVFLRFRVVGLPLRNIFSNQKFEKCQNLFGRFVCIVDNFLGNVWKSDCERGLPRFQSRRAELNR